MREATFLRTSDPEWDSLVPRIRGFLEQDALDMTVDGRALRGYRSPDSRAIWIRDHSDILRGVKYFEPDLKSTVDHFAETQAENGRIFDFISTFPAMGSGEKENWTKYVRVPVEADVEYRFVKAAFLAWQANGDDVWIKRLLPRLDRALRYALTHPWRWDESRKLIKRPYTIDTWDFAYTAGRHDWLQFQITDDTFWGIMHGDISGYYEAFHLLALLYDYFEKADLARSCRRQADNLKRHGNALCWNGRFYTHFVKITPVDIPGVDESDQLSLSNPMNINRGLAEPEMAGAIIREYLARKETTSAFAEWFSIDPPFPDGAFGDSRLIEGAYVNGGIMPLVGGELAKAALDHGFETYGVDILKRYRALIAGQGESYLWYFPDGTPSSVQTSTSPEATPTDGWGSSAMLYALFEGLAGIEDKLKLFRKVRLAPRWTAAGIADVEVGLQYAASGAEFRYSCRRRTSQILLDVEAENSDVQFHVLCPEGLAPVAVTLDGEDSTFTTHRIGRSLYADFRSGIRGGSSVCIRLRKEGKQS